MHEKLLTKPSTWLVTGAAGFIGSHISQMLLAHGQHVVGLDNLSACGRKNLDFLAQTLPIEKWQNFRLIEGDITDSPVCETACEGVDYVLHHAAIGSVPRSFDEPVFVDRVNVGGFVNVLAAAASHKVKSFVYASSSAVYGDYTETANQEDQPLRPLSPYAVSKETNERYASVLAAYYGLPCTGLRYFNVYGSHQDPNGAYAAVIPKWIDKMQQGASVEIYGDGVTARDFCHVSDVARANIIAAASPQKVRHRVYNIGSGKQTSLNQLFQQLRDVMGYKNDAIHREARTGDIRISCADVTRAKTELDFKTNVDLAQGLHEAVG